ncbi:arylsulfotransferase family protein [Patulibacter sp. S7RM1-6]
MAAPQSAPSSRSRRRVPPLLALVVGVLLGGAIALAVWAIAGREDPPARADGGIAAGRPSAPVTVSPQAGSRVASPKSELSFRGATAAQLDGLVVEGSRSGRHPGRAAPHADGQGASFVPDDAFEAGETVTVRAPFAVVGAEDGRYRLRIADLAPRPAGAKTRRGTTEGVRTFRSRPDLRMPELEVYRRGRGTWPGFVFLAPKLGAVPGGPTIVDDRGRVRWFAPTSGRDQAADFRVQRYRGEPVLTNWIGTSSGGEGHGTAVIRDARYRTIKEVAAGNGYTLDMHEFLLTSRGTAYVTIYQPLKWDLRPYGGPRDGTLVDGIVQEIDVATGRVIFEWHSLDHVGVRETVRDLPGKTGDRRLDYFHVNSVDEDADGNLVISARQTDAVYRIERRTGRVLWRLGGRKSDFRLGRGVAFHLQHDARVQSDGAIRLFDNSSEAAGGVSRVKTIAVNEDAGTATLVRGVAHPGTKLFAATQANGQALPDGGLLVGWGSQGRVSEIGPRGQLRFDAELPDGFDSYRAYRHAWTGRPDTRPRIAAEADDDRTSVWASWNGSTETVRWRVLAGASDDALRPAGEAAWDGFETRLRIPGRPARVAVQALDADGKILATSRPRAVAGR